MTETSNIIPMLNVLAQRIRAAYERTERGRHEWIEGTLDLAAALAEARERYTSDREFSHWIVDAGLEDINHQDRAALINMAGDLASARRVLEETKSISWQLIWEHEMKGWVTSASKPHVQIDTAEIPAPTPQITPQAQNECIENPPASTVGPASGARGAN